MSRSVEVQVSDQRLSLAESSLQKGITILDQGDEYMIHAGSLGVAFVSPEECRELHKRFFNDPEITDVMTFPGDPEDLHAGDIAICPEVAMMASLENGMSFQSELSLYLVHAWLHLAGLDDRDEAGRKEMRRAESILMDELAMNSALLSCSWNP